MHASPKPRPLPGMQTGTAPPPPSGTGWQVKPAGQAGRGEHCWVQMGPRPLLESTQRPVAHSSGPFGQGEPVACAVALWPQRPPSPGTSMQVSGGKQSPSVRQRSVHRPRSLPGSPRQSPVAQSGPRAQTAPYGRGAGPASGGAGGATPESAEGAPASGEAPASGPTNTTTVHRPPRQVSPSRHSSLLEQSAPSASPGAQRPSRHARPLGQSRPSRHSATQRPSTQKSGAGQSLGRRHSSALEQPISAPAVAANAHRTGRYRAFRGIRPPAPHPPDLPLV